MAVSTGRKEGRDLRQRGAEVGSGLPSFSGRGPWARLHVENRADGCKVYGKVVAIILYDAKIY